MAVSWGTRKALGRRYSQDPALIMEAERLQREYGLIPGREARAQQAAQFAESINQQNLSRAQQQQQFDATQSANRAAGITGTTANLLTTGAIVRGMTKAPGEPFFGTWGASKAAEVPSAIMAGTTPSAGIQSASNPSFWTGPSSTGGYPGAATDMAGVTPFTAGGVSAVNPATIDATTSGIAAGADVGMGATTGGGAAGATTGVTAAPSAWSTYGVPAAQALALYQGSRWAGDQFKEDTFANRALRDPLTGLAGEGFRGVGKLTGIKELNKVADTMNQVEKDFIQKPIDAVTNFVTNVVSDIFGW